MSETLKSPSNCREYAKKETQDRKRNILHLIENFLRNSNLHRTANCLREEAQLSPNTEICDNVDLDIILQEYQSYYYVKFQRMPKITRKSDDNIPVGKENNKMRKSIKQTTTSAKKSKEKEVSSESEDFQFEIVSLANCQCQQSSTKMKITGGPETGKTNCIGSLRPLCEFEGYSTEWRELAEQVEKDVLPPNPDLDLVKWSDCIGLNEPANLLKEAVVYPILFPNIFKGTADPWKGILLFGPPGTGKTLLAKALSNSEHSVPFINVTSSSYVSKWRGESEKMIKVLFEVAKLNAPTIIFIDELDSLVSKVGGEYQHEASRRFKSELLVQMDGILHTGHHQVFILALTNSPWHLDPALLRRFEKRILIDLPNQSTRMEMFRYHLAKNGREFETNQLSQLAQITHNYSGSDIKLACKEAIMNVLRETIQQSNHDPRRFQKENIRSVTYKDVVNAIARVRSCIQEESVQKYREWNEKFGCK